MLDHHGYEVATAVDAAVAIELCERDQFDVVVVDRNLGAECGAALAAKLVELRPGLRVLFVSGDSAGSDEHELPGAAFLPKPFSMATLGEAVRGLLDPALVAA
jgi:DNA-binding response OmpR family regulator